MPTVTSCLDIPVFLEAKEIITPSSVIRQYLYETIQASSEQFSDRTIIDKIIAEQNALEQYLKIKFHPQVVVESANLPIYRDGDRAILHTTYPVHTPMRLSYTINNDQYFSFDKAWITYYKDRANSNTGFHRYVYLIPYHNFAASGAFSSTNFTESYAYAVFLTQRIFPEVIPLGQEVKFITGFNYIPAEFKDYIRKKVAKELLHQIGEMIRPVGVSSSAGTYDQIQTSVSSAGWWRAPFHDRIRAWTEELKEMLVMLKRRYGPIPLAISP